MRILVGHFQRIPSLQMMLHHMFEKKQISREKNLLKSKKNLMILLEISRSFRCVYLSLIFIYPHCHYRMKMSTILAKTRSSTNFMGSALIPPTINTNIHFALLRMPSTLREPFLVVVSHFHFILNLTFQIRQDHTLLGHMDVDAWAQDKSKMLFSGFSFRYPGIKTVNVTCSYSRWSMVYGQGSFCCCSL